ncbi:Tn3 family transposase, partial [Actinomadura vinacea]|uniref:Tn3 family transposase n=1 Tax=Actinomadura vinacea TaxID=115336 RepID=UPI003CD07560
MSDDGYRRMIGTQLNVQEARHRLARRIAFGNRGQLRQRYREGMEDQIGSLGLALNAVVWWNSLYLDAAVKQLRADGFSATDEMCARLSPICYDHINFPWPLRLHPRRTAPFHDPRPRCHSLFPTLGRSRRPRRHPVTRPPCGQGECVLRWWDQVAEMRGRVGSV